MSIQNHNDLIKLENEKYLNILNTSINMDILNPIKIKWNFRILDLNNVWQNTNGNLNYAAASLKSLNLLFHNKNSTSGNLEEILLDFNNNFMFPREKNLEQTIDQSKNFILCPLQVAMFQLDDPSILPDKSYVLELDIDSLNPIAEDSISTGEILVFGKGNKRADFYNQPGDSFALFPIQDLKTNHGTNTSWPYRELFYDFLFKINPLRKNILIENGKSKKIILNFKKDDTLIIGNINTNGSDKYLKELVGCFKFNKINLYPISSTLSQEVPEKLLKLKILEKLEEILASKNVNINEEI